MSNKWRFDLDSSGCDVAFVLDLTGRKRAEEALRESERRLRSVIDGIPGQVAVFAPNGDLEAVNRQIVEYSGRSLEELKSWSTNGTVHPDDLPHLFEVFTKSIGAGVPYETETRLRRFDGEYRWFDIRGVALRDGVRGIQRDHAFVEYTAGGEAKSSQGHSDTEYWFEK